GETVDREVLAELPVHEVVAGELLLPVAVRVQLVDQHRTLLSAVAGEVSLPVAVDVQPAHHAGPIDGPLPYARVHRPPAPGHVLWQSDVHRHECRRPSIPPPVAYHAGRARTTRLTERGVLTGRTSAAGSACSHTLRAATVWYGPAARSSPGYPFGGIPPAGPSACDPARRARNCPGRSRRSRRAWAVSHRARTERGVNGLERCLGSRLTC